MSTKDLRTFSAILYEPDDIVELRLLAKGKKTIQRWIEAKKLPQFHSFLLDYNQQGYNIHIAPNPRKEKGRSGDDNVLLARCLFCDFDNMQPGDGCGRLEFVLSDIFLTGFPEPTLAVHSGHGIHTYWRLHNPIYDLAVWRAMQSQLNDCLNADRTIRNPERLMRFPGFLNTKKNPYQECFVCWSHATCKQSI
jgi:hypothetical protein